MSGTSIIAKFSMSLIPKLRLWFRTDEIWSKLNIETLPNVRDSVFDVSVTWLHKDAMWTQTQRQRVALWRKYHYLYKLYSKTSNLKWQNSSLLFVSVIYGLI